MGLVLGGVSTADLQAEEIMELQDQYPFSQSEIRRLYRRFKKLDNTRNGVITRAQLLKIPELSMNPLAQRIISLFHPPPDASVTSSSDERRIRDAINFNDFLKMLSVFSESSPVIEKERLAFLLYDIDKDGFISENELFEVMKTMVGDNVNDDDLRTMVKSTIKDGDTTGDGKLNFNEFRQLMKDEDIQSKMTIQFSADDLRE
jgi:serine/threonine-protein phosphatase 2B regulatory subunit